MATCLPLGNKKRMEIWRTSNQAFLGDLEFINIIDDIYIYIFIHYTIHLIHNLIHLVNFITHFQKTSRGHWILDGWKEQLFTRRSIEIEGQIIATSHDRFPPNGGLVREIILFQGNGGEILWFGQEDAGVLLEYFSQTRCLPGTIISLGVLHVFFQGVSDPFCRDINIL